MAGKILIVDDEKDMLVLLQRIIREETDHETVTQSDPFRALELLDEDGFDLIITDLKMPRMDGIKLLEEVKKIRQDVAVIIMTAYATIETAVEAIQKGAYDYITKPFRRERILLAIDKVMKWQAMVRENIALREALAEKESPPPLVGSSHIMKGIFERIRQVAPTMATILITGDSGTGKELVARAIHQHSMRSSKRFFTINCTAIPEQVIESELFGHVKGAFTGAWKDKRGLVAEADGGTLFLDEIGDLTLPMQTKLLRLLQEGEYKPVGGVVTSHADLRFIAATNHDLIKDMEAKQFREDLYYRLNVINIELPPLKERKEDIPLLSHYFLRKYRSINQKEIEGISQLAMQLLLDQEYPGNVRELENIIERGVIFCKGNTIGPHDLFPDDKREGRYREFNDSSELGFRESKDKMIQMFHRQYIKSLLRENRGNISRAARMAGIKRQYLYRLIKETGIDARNFRNKIDH